MSWSGTVTCSVCYKSGHNKSSCPTQTERLKSRLRELKRDKEALEALPTDDPTRASRLGRRAYNIHSAETALRRRGFDPDTGLKLAKKDRPSYRKCSYCKERGHTRRTCDLFKDDRDWFIVKLRAARQEALTKLEAAGVTVGAMLKINYTGWISHPTWFKEDTDRPTHVSRYPLVGLLADNISCGLDSPFDSDISLFIEHVVGSPKRYGGTLPLRPEVKFDLKTGELTSPRTHDRAEFLSPGSSKGLGKSMVAWAKLDEVGVKEVIDSSPYFTKGEARDFYLSRHRDEELAAQESQS